VTENGTQGQYAGIVSRTIAFFIDLVLIAVTGILIVAVLGLLRQFFVGSGFGEALGLGDVLGWALSLAAGLATGTLALVYTVSFWSLNGITPGKALLGLQVLRSDGQRLTVRRALLRYVGYFLSALPLFLGFAWIVVNDRRQGWHDKLADTVVVYVHDEVR
jgi:uncharacterized RDD family membrane protein YckC